MRACLLAGHPAVSEPEPRAAADNGVAASRQLAGDLPHPKLGPAAGDAPRGPPGLDVSPPRLGQGRARAIRESPIAGRSLSAATGEAIAGAVVFVVDVVIASKLVTDLSGADGRALFCDRDTSR